MKSGASLQVSLPLQDLIEERRHVTMVFADVSGSVAMASRQDPEETREVLRSCLIALARRIQRYGGTVDKYIGDAVMAVFGAPTSHEDDTERALYAAIAMRDAIAELNLELQRKHGLTLTISIGVNSGEVVAGVIAGDVQAAYTVVGDTVNVAQRLEAAAKPNEIVVGASVKKEAPSFDFAPLPPLTVKGKDQPLTVFRLVGPNAARSRGRLTQLQMSSTLVGRNGELGALIALVKRLEDGHGGLVAIIGDAGSGKSRLLAELKRETASMSVTWLEGRCFTLGETTRYAPFVEALSRMAGFEVGDDDARRYAKLEARVHAVVRDDVDEVLPYLAALLAIDPPEPAATRLSLMSGEAMGRQIFRAARRFLTLLARTRPLVLAFEDLHWADASTIALAQHVVRATAEAPVLVIGTSRPDPSSPAAELRKRIRGLPRYTEILLGPLPDEHADMLMRNLLAVDDLPEEVRDLTLRRAEGNPLYIEEIIRSLVDSGVVVRDESSGRWRAATDAARIELPDTIGGLIVARLDRLDDRPRQVLRTAAVIGRTFRISLLRAVEQSSDLEKVLDVLVDQQILVERRPGPDPEYMFRHVLIQEVLYESLLRRQRRDMHAQVASAIEKTYADHVGDFVGALAYHYARAERWEEAVTYLERAGDQAGHVAADADAVERYRDAMSAYDATGRAAPLQIASLERKLGEALYRRGEHGQAVLSLRSALRRLGAPLPETRGAMVRAIIAAALVQVAHRLMPRRRALTAPSDDPVTVERQRVYTLFRIVDYYSSDGPRHLLISLRMLNGSESAGRAAGIAHGSAGVSAACDMLGLKRLAAGYCQRGLAAAEAAGDPVAAGIASFGLAFHEHGVGAWDAALVNWGRGSEAFWNVRDLRAWGVSCWGVGFSNWRRGNTAATRDLALRMLEVAEDGGDNVLRGWGLCVLGRAQWTFGEDAAALASLQESVAILRAVPDRQILVRALGDIGFCALRKGDLARATAAFDEATQLIGQHRIRGYYSHVLNWRLLACLEHAERANGPAQLDWYRRADTAIAAAERQARVDAEAWPALLRYRGRYHWLRGDRARAEREWNASVERAERLRFVPELGWTHAEIGWWLNRPEQIDRAGELFDQMGARGEVARLNAMRMSADRR